MSQGQLFNDAPRPWTTSEVEWLRRNRHLGIKACAEALERTPASVRHCASKHRISLRLPGSRRGLVLGQPHGTSLKDSRDRVMAELRALALEGKVDLTEVERRIREDRSLPICPLCSRFPVRRPSWGTCDPCHKHHLAEQHEEELAKLEGQRHLWVARKHLKETRKQLGIKAPGARD